MKTCHETSQAIHGLSLDECDALQKYEDFLAKYSEKMDANDVHLVQKIISEEKNHLILFIAMARRYDSSIAPSSDNNIMEAIRSIQKGIKE